MIKKLFSALLLFLPVVCRAADPLPSWSEGANKEAIIDFVAAVCSEGGPSYVAPEERIAVFDNDGTLWAEKPVVQLVFVPAERFVSGQTGMTQTEYRRAAAGFFAETPALSLRYRPQLELLDYLRANGFTIYICSGGSVEFIRVISEEYYGIPPEHVIGTEFKYAYDEELNDIRRLPEINTFNDKQQKPVNIQYHIGRRPILACGNAGGAGDIQMLRFSQGSPHPSLQLVVNHDDGEREFLYGEDDDLTLEYAGRYGWRVISMKNDWKTIFSK